MIIHEAGRARIIITSFERLNNLFLFSVSIAI